MVKKQKPGLLKIVAKELAKEAINTTHQRLTVAGGWGPAGGKKAVLDLIKKVFID